MSAAHRAGQQPIQRAAIGALMGATACFILSSLLVQGISIQRTVACAIGAVIGAVIYARSARVAWIILLLSIAAWCAVAFTPLARSVSNGLVRSDPIPQSVDAVVVLSGNVTRDGMLGAEALDRLLEGIALIRAGRAPTIVITEPQPWDDSPINTSADQQRLIALLPTVPRVIVIRGVVSTRTEALGTVRQLPPNTVHTLAVVTSPLHTRRACRVFVKVGYKVVCVPSESRDIALHSLSMISDRLAAFRMAVQERLAFALYHHRGWV